jgi:large subunit ribosomal protein L23
MKNTLIKPVITEKSMRLAATGVYTFEVEPHVTKSLVKVVLQELYGVHVIQVNTRVGHLEAKRTGARRLPGKTGTTKFCLCRVKAGETITLFDFKEEK